MTAVDDLRTAQVADTKRRIAKAVLEVLARDGAARTSFPAVAEQAGVSLRTVYRHFPNKEALLSAGVTHGSDEATAMFPVGSRRIGTMREFLPVLWHELASNRDVIQAQHTTPAGIELRGVRLRARLEEARAAVAVEHPELGPEDQERVAHMVTVLMSSTVLFDLVDHLGADIDTAADLVARAMEAIAAHPGGTR